LPRFNPFFSICNDVSHSLLAYDLRALQADFRRGLAEIVQQELRAHFGAHFSSIAELPLLNKLLSAMYHVVDHTTSMDAVARMVKVAEASTSLLVEFFMATSDLSLAVAALTALPTFRATVASRAAAKLVALREEYLLGARGPAPASALLEKTRPIYEFIRVTLGIRMHGTENLGSFKEGLGVQDVTVGQNVSLIHEVRRPFLLAYMADIPQHSGYSGWQDAGCRCGVIC
jgi:phenylalanine ammonia-lyase